MKPLSKILVLAFIGLYLCQTTFALGASNLKGFYSNFEGVKAFDQNNQSFNFAQLQNKLTVFNFIYTQCSNVCHTQTQALSTVFHQLPVSIRQQVAFVSVSLDPLKDGPSVLKKYAKRFNADEKNWHFLSLNFFDIKELSENLILFKPDYGKTLYDALENSLQDKGNVSYNLAEHATHLWLIDTSGVVRQKYVGNPVDTTRLAKEINALHRVEFNR